MNDDQLMHDCGQTPLSLRRGRSTDPGHGNVARPLLNDKPPDSFIAATVFPVEF